MPKPPRRTCRCRNHERPDPECIQAAADYQHAYWLMRKKYIRRNSWVDATGTRRRIQALGALGHTFATISEESGVVKTQVARIARGSARADEPKVAQSTADKIRGAYDRLSMVLGDSVVTRSRAARKGWVPPLAWTDELIDDPAASPAGVREKDPHGLDLDDWWYLVRSGEDPERAAERCGVTIDAVERSAYRAGRAELAATASRARNARRGKVA